MDKLKDDEEIDYYQPFAEISKTTVLHGCKKFNELKYVKNRWDEVCHLLTQLLYLLAQGKSPFSLCPCLPPPSSSRLRAV